MLELVSLTPAEAERRVRNYSLGMRQRLGIAHALLGDPQVLILDEPANGLDPAGIRWMRGLLRDYADRGGTVLLSSHLLHEIEVIADDLIVIGSGKIVAQGTEGRPAVSGPGRSCGPVIRRALAAALKAADADRHGVRRPGSRSDASPESVAQIAADAGRRRGRDP